MKPSNQKSILEVRNRISELRWWIELATEKGKAKDKEVLKIKKELKELLNKLDALEKKGEAKTDETNLPPA